MIDFNGVSSAWKSAAQCYKDGINIEANDVHCIVEIGVDYGFSLFKMATDFPDALVVGIDDYNHHCDAKQAEETVRSILPQFKNVRLLKATSADAARAWKEPGNYLDIDILHIDADHSYEGVMNDYLNWSPMVRDGGVIMFHDVSSHKQSVGRFFSELAGRKKIVDEGGAGLGILFKDADARPQVFEPPQVGLMKEKDIRSSAASLKVRMLKRLERLKELYQTLALSFGHAAPDVKEARIDSIVDEIETLKVRQSIDAASYAAYRHVLGVTRDLEQDDIELLQ